MSPDAQRKVLGLSYAVEKQAHDLKKKYPGRIVTTIEDQPIRALDGIEGLAHQTADTFLEIANALRLIASEDK